MGFDDRFKPDVEFLPDLLRVDVPFRQLRRDADHRRGPPERPASCPRAQCAKTRRRDRLLSDRMWPAALALPTQAGRRLVFFAIMMAGAQVLGPCPTAHRPPISRTIALIGLWQGWMVPGAGRARHRPRSLGIGLRTSVQIAFFGLIWSRCADVPPLGQPALRRAGEALVARWNCSSSISWMQSLIRSADLGRVAGWRHCRGASRNAKVADRWRGAGPDPGAHGDPSFSMARCAMRRCCGRGGSGDLRPGPARLPGARCWADGGEIPMIVDDPDGRRPRGC